MGMYKLTPYVKQAIWGGKKLYAEYGKRGFEEIAETWELSGFSGKESVVSGGEFDGKTVTQLISELGGRKALGERAPEDGSLPLLIKFIDSASPLSIQVHPDAETAEKIGGDAASKTEMWFICEEDEGDYLYFGVNKDLTKAEFEEILKAGTLTVYLNRGPVKK
ncbi:MAG: mannose-6-phosphate isomerase, partial [Clostridia bacterium]|nr:mannose-6-phosphate isomerase [Clostridia bacterium]